jgi:hypothetical protein
MITHGLFLNLQDSKCTFEYPDQLCGINGTSSKDQLKHQGCPLGYFF